MSNLFKYHSTIEQTANPPSKLAEQLPDVIAKELHQIYARDVAVTPSSVSFLEGASQNPHKRWIKLSYRGILLPFSQGEVEINHKDDKLLIDYWLGLPKWFVYAITAAFLPVSSIVIWQVLRAGQPSLGDLLIVIIVLAGFLLLTVLSPLAMSLIRFRWFLNQCIQKATQA